MSFLIPWWLFVALRWYDLATVATRVEVLLNISGMPPNVRERLMRQANRPLVLLRISEEVKVDSLKISWPQRQYMKGLPLKAMIQQVPWNGSLHQW